MASHGIHKVNPIQSVLTQSNLPNLKTAMDLLDIYLVSLKVTKIHMNSAHENIWFYYILAVAINMKSTGRPKVRHTYCIKYAKYYIKI